MTLDWEAEIVECGDLIQDDDGAAVPGEGEGRWHRYTELADPVTGTEGVAGVVALVSSLKAEEDYGAYESAHAALARFPPSELGTGVASRAARQLLSLPKGNSGSILLMLTRSGPAGVDGFSKEIQSAGLGVRRAIYDLVRWHGSEE